MNFDDVLSHPVIIPSSPKSPRPCNFWTFQTLSDVLKDKKLSCRVWKKSYEQVLETACDHVNVSIEEFDAWLKSKAQINNPLNCYDRSSHAAYIDYKYMKDVFSDCQEKLQEVQWTDFGLPEFDGKDSTIWIGSEGANTPGHQDSYGFNLVTQIAGRKMWILFPPADRDCLYPTRIPYEESSIFSHVQFGYPDIEKYPAIKNCHPRVVILHPGQTLYVPLHWWHYVESLDPSISINVWVPHKDDSNSRLTESLTRCLATNILSGLKADCFPLYRQLLNPTETLCSQSENISFLKTAIEKVLEPSVAHTPCKKEHRQTSTEIIYETDGDGIKMGGNGDFWDYLWKFGNWMKTFCCIIPSPLSPCIGLDSTHCVDYLEGCISHRTTFIEDEKSSVATRHNTEYKSVMMKPKLCIDDQKDEDKDIEHELASNKRTYKREECDSRSSKKVKSVDGSVFGSETDERYQCDVIPNRFSSQGVESYSNCSTYTDVKADDIGLKHSVYSLSKPFPFDRFLHLMRVKKSSVVFEKNDSFHLKCSRIRRRGDEIDFSKPNEMPTSCACINPINKNSECSRYQKQTMLESSTVPSDKPAPCSSFSSIPSLSERLQLDTKSLLFNPDNFTSSSTDANNISSNSQSSFKDENIKIEKCNDENIKTQPESCACSESFFLDNAAASSTEKINSSEVPLTEDTIHRFLFESVLHPSTVDHIAGLFKTKCENLFQNNMKSME